MKKVSEYIIYIQGDKEQIVNICFTLLTKATWNNALVKKIVTDKNHQNVY